MVCGVYKILNTKTGKFYIGSSKDINKRFKDHIRKLKNCVHHSAKLQNSCNKHGVSSPTCTFVLHRAAKAQEI